MHDAYCSVIQSYLLPLIQDLIKTHHFDKSQRSGTPAVSTMAHLASTRFTPAGIPVLGAGLSFSYRITPRSSYNKKKGRKRES
ncbi:hypothetical protein ACQKWADRAFT_277788 [Trichoderma austrokoningii]